MFKVSRLVVLIICCNISVSYSEVGDSPTSFWSKAKKASGEAWSKSKKFSLDFMKDSKAETSKVDVPEKFIDSIWKDVISKLDEGTKISEKIKLAPKSALFGDDKASLQEEFDETLEEVIDLVLDKNLISYKKLLGQVESKIKSIKLKILNYRESKVVAPVKSLTATTKSGFDEKISDAKVEIAALKKEKIKITEKLIADLKNMGIDLSRQQVEVLLVRIDGDDIVQMTLIMDVLQQITNQLSILMEDSGEELTYAKKYYGMHMIVLELIVYIQEKYITKVNNIYLPKIENIMLDTSRLIKNGVSKMKSDKSSQRRKRYKNNIKSQKLTFIVAKDYKGKLLEQKKNVSKAKKISSLDLELSKNTYETVSISSDLNSLIADSKKTFSAVLKLQTPNIIPFKNLKMKSKYEEITKQMSN